MTPRTVEILLSDDRLCLDCVARRFYLSMLGKF